MKLFIIAGLKLEKLEGRIQYADVSFSYPSRPTVCLVAYTEVFYAFSVYVCCSHTGASDVNILYWEKNEGEFFFGRINFQVWFVLNFFGGNQTMWPLIYESLFLNRYQFWED